MGCSLRDVALYFGGIYLLDEERRRLVEVRRRLLAEIAEMDGREQQPVQPISADVKVLNTKESKPSTDSDSVLARVVVSSTVVGALLLGRHLWCADPHSRHMKHSKAHAGQHM